MNLTGQKVKQIKYGDGVVVKQENKYIFVKFDSVEEIKKFESPLCLNFLRFADPKVENEMKDEVLRKERERIEKSKKEAEERERDEIKQQIYRFSEKFKKSVQAEIDYIKENGGKKRRLFDGKLIESQRGRYIYTFESEDELNLPDGTQISVFLDSECIAAEIIGCEDFNVTILSKSDLGAEVSDIEFFAESWRLLSALQDRIDETIIKPTGIVRALICDGPGSIDFSDKQMATGQKEAVEMSMNQPILFIWGPPGTGKTETLAQIALKHISLGHRVLMLSYSNVSVDGATLRVYKRSGEDAAGKIVRYGYPRDKELLNHKFLTSYNLVIHEHPELMQERNSLLAEKKTLSRTSKRYVQIDRRLKQINKVLSDEVKQTGEDARFVATTVSKAVVDTTIRNAGFDVVIFDEASMAYIPQIIFSASLASKHFICMGDFNQLPPIVQSKESDVLGENIFKYCGICDAVDKGVNHRWLCMLDTQYRMHPQISNFVSLRMYGGKLKSADQMADKRKNIVDSAPAKNHAVALADLTGMMSVCTKTGDDSRINVLSAFLSMALALEAAADHDVGIITPYRAQSRLLNAMAKDVAEANPGLHPVACATVHQFQGSEKDVILYDVVECYRLPYPGKMLTDMKNDYANRLFNVALTRAKGKFIGVANVSFFETKNLSDRLMLERLIGWQKNNDSCMKGEEIIRKRLKISGSELSFYDYSDACDDFKNDMLSATSEIRIDIPGKPVEDAFLREVADILVAARGRGVKVTVRVVRKKDLPEYLKTIAVENPFAANPVVLIDKKTVWFGMPGSDDGFELKNGEKLKAMYYPFIRFSGRRTALSLYGFLGMGQTIDRSDPVERKPKFENFANYVSTNKICVKCGSRMRLQKTKSGKYFLSCSGYPKCENPQPIDLDFVNQYLQINDKRCYQCNCPLEAREGKYGVYIQCSGHEKHKYKFDEI